MQFSLLRRQKITLVLISLLSFYSGAHVLVKNIEAIGKQKIFLISEYEKSLSQIKKDITNYESVGYVADKPIDTSSGEYATAMYYLTQYAVAPTVVTLHKNEEFIIGNFSTIETGIAFAKQHKLKISKNLRNGLFLYKR